MTAVTLLVIRCDFRSSTGGCGAEGSLPQPVFSATELRTSLAYEGWRRTRAGDLCPTHANPSALSAP